MTNEGMTERGKKQLMGCFSTLSPCQGRLPRRKYINMWPRASRSSRLLCSEITEQQEKLDLLDSITGVEFNTS